MEKKGAVRSKGPPALKGRPFADTAAERGEEEKCSGKSDEWGGTNPKKKK